MSQNPAKLPSNVIAIGRAVGDFTLRTGVSAKGKAFQIVSGRMVSGSTFVNITEMVQQGQMPFLPSDGEEVRACVIPNYKDDGLLSLDAQIIRPDVASGVAKK
jgi:hypothetical protein